MISVIVPVYNVEKFLHKCLDSIINQTYKDLEIILINDGSTDNSGAICDEYAQRDKRIKVIHKENAGVSAARNDGLKCATGEYITFVDSDDYIECNMYELLILNMIKYDSDISHCGYKRVTVDGETIKEINGTGVVLEHSSVEAIENMLSGKYYSPSLCNKVFCKRLFDNIQFCEDLKNNEDVLCAFEVFQNANSTVYIDDSLYCYVIHNQSACHTLNSLFRALDSVKASERMMESCKNTSLKGFLFNRYVSVLINAYRTFLLGKENDLSTKIYLKNKLKISKKKIGLSKKNKINLCFIIYLPNLYTLAYRIYSKIRKPNWDATV